MKLFQIMPCRFSSLQSTIDGYEQTKTRLISFNDYCNFGKNFGIGPAGLTEESGAYYYIPSIVDITGQNLETVVNLFYGGIVTIALILGVIGSCKYCDTRIGKFISVLALSILSFLIAGISDIYVVTGASTVALVPWLLYIQKKSYVKWILRYSIIAGFVIGFSHSIRSHSGTGVYYLLFFQYCSQKNIT